MNTQVYIFMGVVAAAALCGLANAIVNFVMVKSLNRVYSSENKIPLAITNVAQWKAFTGNSRLPYFRVLKEYHQQFPESPLYFWSIFLAIGMLAAFLFAGLVLVFSLRST